jgi:hypothetical protein
MRKMGEVFLLRANIAAVGSVLDSPEVFWVSATAGATDRDAQGLTLRAPVVPRPSATLRRSAKLSRDPTAHQPTQHPRRGAARHAAAFEGVRV